MASSSPPPENRRCETCGRTLSLNFFGLDTNECRTCQRQRQAPVSPTTEQPA